MKGHVPEARDVSLDAGAPNNVNGRHPPPIAADFAATLATLGIGHDDTVVAYDAHGVPLLRAWSGC